MLQTLFQMLFLAAMHANASFALHFLSHAIIWSHGTYISSIHIYESVKIWSLIVDIVLC